MDSLMIKLPVAVTDNTLPKIPVVTNEGSILLMDNSLDKVSINGYKAALDAISTGVTEVALVNRAAAQAAALGISDTSIVLRGTYDKKVAISETTAKGGLHIAHPSSSQASQVGNWSGLWLSTDVADYLNANKGHVIFGSIWGRTTKVGINLARLLAVGANTSNYFINIYGGSSNDGGSEGTYRNGGSSTLGNFRANAAGTFVVNSGGLTQVVTNTIHNWVTGPTGVIPAHILYRIYLEDLTVSGRTYEQAASDDEILYTSAIEGRLSGDTWTNPS